MNDKTHHSTLLPALRPLNSIFLPLLGIIVCQRERPAVAWNVSAADVFIVCRADISLFYVFSVRQNKMAGPNTQSRQSMYCYSNRFGFVSLLYFSNYLVVIGIAVGLFME